VSSVKPRRVPPSPAAEKAQKRQRYEKAGHGFSPRHLQKGTLKGQRDLGILSQTDKTTNSIHEVKGGGNCHHSLMSGKIEGKETNGISLNETKVFTRASKRGGKQPRTDGEWERPKLRVRFRG